MWPITISVALPTPPTPIPAQAARLMRQVHEISLTLHAGHSMALLDATVGNWHSIDPNHPPYCGTDGRTESHPRQDDFGSSVVVERCWLKCLLSASRFPENRPELLPISYDDLVPWCLSLLICSRGRESPLCFLFYAFSTEKTRR